MTTMLANAPSISANKLFKVKATEIIPADFPEAGLSEALSINATREELVASLQSMGRKGEASAMHFGYAQDVSAMLTHQDPTVVSAACEALGSMGQAADGYAQGVARLLKSPSPGVRSAAASALGMFGPAAGKPYVGALKEAMDEDQDEGARCAAVGALGQIGAQEQAEPIAELLSSQSPVLVAAALQALGELGTAGEAHAAEIAAKLKDQQVRYAAVCALLNLGDGTIEKHLADIISKCLTDPDSLTRTAAAEALGKVAVTVAGSKDDMSKIAAGLKDDHAGVRCSAALALGYMGEKAADQAEAIAGLLTDKAEDRTELHLTVGGGSMRSPPSARRPKCAALLALGMIGPGSHAGACAACLDDEEWEVRMCALECLALAGDAGRAQASKISACLEDDVFVVRAKACECLGSLQAEDGAANVPDLFEDKAPSVRCAALMALAECPEVAQGYSSEVFKCMNDQVPSVQAAAIYCLGCMGDTGRCYASMIATKLTDEDPGLRAAACEALGKLGDHGAAFAEEVAANLLDGVPEVRMRAAQALGKMGPEGVPFMDGVQYLLSDVGEVSLVAKEAVLALENASAL